MTDGHRRPRAGVTYRPRLKGDERQRMARDLARYYDAGASIRALAGEHQMSYGTVRKLLKEARVRLRGRGGRTKQT